MQTLLDDTIAGRVNPAEHKRLFTYLKDAWRQEQHAKGWGAGWPSNVAWNRLARFQDGRRRRAAEVARLDRKVADWAEEAARMDAELAAPVAA